MTDDAAPARREYDRLAAEYDRRWRPYIDATLTAVLEAVQLNGSEILLDVPCGTGELARRLLPRYPGLRIIGADISLDMLRQADAKAIGRQASWLEADVARLPLRDGSFDVVVCANSFHYFPFPEESLREFKRVLKADGTLVLVDWCDNYLTCKLCSLWLKWTDPAFRRMYSLRDCRTLLEDAGFQVESLHRFRVNWLWGMMRVVCR
jgi:ubiquinone/menaquinone biosynthesis C-methylase UbiE